jgi:hypothetical protein
MTFQRRGGRKRIVAPDGTEIAPSMKPQPDGTLVKALARAWRWQRLLDDGVYSSISDIGDADLEELREPDPPDYAVKAILTGRTDQSLMLKRLERPLPASWEEQRNFCVA